MSSHIKFFNTAILVLLIASYHLNGMKTTLDVTIENAQQYSITNKKLISFENKIKKSYDNCTYENPEQILYDTLKNFADPDVNINTTIKELDPQIKKRLKTMLESYAGKSIKTQNHLIKMVLSLYTFFIRS